MPRSSHHPQHKDPTRVTQRQREILETFMRSRESNGRRFLVGLSRFLKKSVDGYVNIPRDAFSLRNALMDATGQRIKIDERELRRRLTAQFSRLKKAGYVRMRKDGPRLWSYTLTPAGRSVVLRALVAQAQKRHKPGMNLRLLVFDIPETERRLRDYFRLILNDLGFEYCQRSVWVSPYPIEHELAEVVALLGNRAYVRLYRAQEIAIEQIAPEDRWHIV